ncbi:MAG: DUF1003 domain-containing protein [Pirellulaceae bacterium]|nr:DUF1003 domain-containing protein [Pirellulaceae bacterium]
MAKAKHDQAAAPLLTTAKKNIQAIARVEHELHVSRSRVERIGDGITHFFGSLRFIAAHALVLAAWIVLNSQELIYLAPFDPYPFPLLSFIFSVEFSTVKANRMPQGTSPSTMYAEHCSTSIGNSFQLGGTSSTEVFLGCLSPRHLLGSSCELRLCYNFTTVGRRSS